MLYGRFSHTTEKSFFKIRIFYINNGLEGRFDVLIEEVRVTNRSTAILANNNSLVRYDLFEYVKLRLCNVISVLARKLTSVVFLFDNY